MVYVTPTVLRTVRISVSDGGKSCGRLIRGTIPLWQKRKENKEVRSLNMISGPGFEPQPI